MPFNYAGLQKTADSLVTQFGRSVTYRQRAVTIPDTARPWEATKADVDSTVDVVFMDFGDAEKQSSVVEENDSRILVASKDLGLTPTAGDMIVDGTEVYVMVYVSEVKPGGTALIYDLHVRK